MKIDAGRSKLFAALKETRVRWQQTTETWDDSARQEHEEHVWGPLDTMSAEVLRAMDELGQVLHQVRQECERSFEDFS